MFPLPLIASNIAQIQYRDSKEDQFTDWEWDYEFDLMMYKLEMKKKRELKAAERAKNVPKSRRVATKLVSSLWCIFLCIFGFTASSSFEDL